MLNIIYLENKCNYQRYFSIILLGTAHADCCFFFADIGFQGRISDGGVTKNTTFYNKLQNKQLNLRCEEVLGNRDTKIPSVFVGDYAFGLEYNVIKSYPVQQKKGSKQGVFI